MTRKRVLTDAQVQEIRLLYKPGIKGYGYRELARKYGVGESTIRDLLTSRTMY